MKASELRIGNWVTDEFGDQVQVFEVNEIYASVYEPIPLTPEILQKCGFEKDYSGYKHDSQFSIYTTKDGYFMPAWMDKTIWPYPLFDKKIDYLHQLQNLFYAISGEELNYQP